MEHHPLIGFLFAGAEDRDHARPALTLLTHWGIVAETAIISGRLQPLRAARWADEAEDRGLQALVVVAKHEPSLAELVSANSLLPVIAATDCAVSTGGPQLPPVIRAAGPMEAALLGLQIAARASAPACEALAAYRERLADDWERQFPEATRKPSAPAFTASPDDRRSDQSQQRDLPPTPREAPRFEPLAPPPVASVRPPEPRPAPAPGLGSIAASIPGFVRRPSQSGRIRIESDMLPMDVIERAVEVLQSGGIVALPTDTVYGLAVDASNVRAVERLNALKDRPSDKALAVFIDSTRLLGSVATGVNAEVRSLLEAFWPGPLTVIFQRRAEEFGHLAEGNTIGVRVPNHNVPLILTQELRRPIACTSANPSGMPEARSGDEVEEYFGREVDLILDAGRLPPGPASTVIDVTRTPYRVLREGAISRQQLAAVAGNSIRTEG